MLEVIVLGSGSSGNATVVRTPSTSVLIDAGMSLRQITMRMGRFGLDPEVLDGVVVSHEHGDHIKGLRVLCGRHGTTVFACEGLQGTREFAEAAPTRVETIKASAGFNVGDLEFTPFPIPHDAADPLAFVIRNNGVKFGYATDVGYATALLRYHLRGCNILVLESNHDPNMLIDGPYPWPVKQRILGRTGHLSNADSADLLSDVMGPDLQTVLLAHLSRENNTPEMARVACASVLGLLDSRVLPEVIVTSQDEPSPAARCS